VKEFKFSVEQIKGMLKKMVVLVDSREQKNGHILDYFQRQGIAYEVQKLDYGDYSCKIPAMAAGKDIYFHDSIVIERKNSLEEISGNFSKGRERLEMEFLKARNAGAKIYLLVESPLGYTGIITHGYKTQMKPAAFMASLKTWEHRFDANIQFIDPVYSGYYIASTLQYFVREALR
jgi:hypothetical protein